MGGVSRLFTGIIEFMGSVQGVDRRNEIVVLKIRAPPKRRFMEGESVCVNGACLSVARVDKSVLEFELMPETQRRTALSHLKVGDRVNLERSLRLGTRLGGHLVTGHVDCVGEIVERVDRIESSDIKVRVTPQVASLLVEKGSVAVDGVSLTVVDVGADWFSVSLIPYTLAKTTLGFRRKGDPVNVEADIVGKYIRKFVVKQQEATPTQIHGYTERHTCP